MLVKHQEELHQLKVVASNTLIRASYKLSKRALIFMLYLIAKIDSINQDQLIDIFMSYSQIVSILNFDGKRRISHRREVFALLEELNEVPIFWEDSENEDLINWLSSINRKKKTDIFRLRIDPALTPHLLKLKDHFTEFFFRFALPMESSSTRVY